MKQIFWMELFIVMAIALSYMTRLCGGTSVCSPSTFGTIGSKNKDGALQFPVFHWKHPCLQPSDSSSSPAAQLHPAAALLPEQANPVVADDTIHKGKFLMVISLGTPAIFNLVTIDTGSTLSWVQCRPCQVTCKTFAAEAGPTFDPRNSTTYQRVACSSQDCAAVHELVGVPFGCDEETDTCLYSMRYGSSGPLAQYSAGRLGKDRLSLTLAREFDDDAVDEFIFGCSEDVRFAGREAGILGFGNDRLSFVNQVMTARQATTTSTGGYNAFSYCFPGDHDARGFLSIGPYARDDGLAFTNLVLGYGQDRRRPFVYSIQQLDMTVDGRRLDVDPRAYTAQMMIVDSGTQATFLLAPVFDALDKAVTAAMAGKGYARVELPNDDEHKVCFVVTSTPTIDQWTDLPTVEMKFTGTTVKLPPRNAFNERFVDADRLLCLPFQPRYAGVSGVQILGNRVTRSFRVVFDLQARMLGLQPDAC